MQDKAAFVTSLLAATIVLLIPYLLCRVALPVYSAETTDGEEAEFIRDRLPDRLPTAAVLVAVVAVGAAVLWLAR